MNAHSTSARTAASTEAGLIRDVLRQAMPSARRFLPGLLSAVLSDAAVIGLLLVSGWLIVSASLVDTLVPLSVAVVGVRFFAVSRAVFRYLERLTGHDAALRQLAPLRSGIVRRLTPLSPAGLGRTDRGSVLSALVDDVENLQNLPLRVVQPLLSGGIIAATSVLVMLLISPAAALSLAVCLLLATLIAVFLGWVWGDRAERAVAQRRGELSAALVDYLTGLDVLLAYGVEPQARQRIREADAALRRTVTRAALAQAASAAVVSIAAGVASIWALSAAVPGTTGGAVDAPWFAVAVMLPMAVFDVFAVVPQAASSWREVRASAQRIARVVPVDVPPEVRLDEPIIAADTEADTDGVSAPSVTPAAGPQQEHTPRVRLRGIRAHWPHAQHPALDGVDLDVAPGEKVLITGTSGAGKSTLAAVLAGFLNYSGQYQIGDTDAASLAGPELRRIVGLCEQTPQLFDEDLRQNLLFARDTASDEELWDVLDRVGLGAWARDRGGLDARVGDRGALVSGGQAQRLALARALLRDFPVLVLDEPTAGVDPDASATLLRDLLRASDHQTVILISHVAPPAGSIDREVRLSGKRLTSDKNQ